jgi:hypothetical protein
MAAKKQQNDNGLSTNTTVGIGLAVAAVAAAAGGYFLYGAKDAKRNRKMVRGWALKAKGEVLEGIEKMKDTVTEEAYYKVVDTVVGKYASYKNATSEEVDALGKELKSHWKSIKNHLGGSNNKKTSKPKTKKASSNKSTPKKTGNAGK